MTSLARQVESPSPDVLSGTWVPATDQTLGISARHVRRLFRDLRPLGAARKIGGVYWFDRNHPEIVRRVRRADSQASYDDLSQFSDRQVADARWRYSVVDAGRREISARMLAACCGRTDAVRWFVEFRAAELGLVDDARPVSMTTYYRWERALDASPRQSIRALIDTRGGGGGGGDASVDPDAWRLFCEHWLGANKLSVRTCYAIVASRAEEMGWAWPALRTIQARAAAIPKPARVLRRDGREALEKQCVPRSDRDRSESAAHDRWCGDEHTLDCYCRVVDGKGQWKSTRPVLTAWLDERTRTFVGWTIDGLANSDTIIAAFKRGVAEFSTPLSVHMDNGADYKATAGRKRKWGEFDEARLVNLWSDLGVAVHWATPYSPWAKIIESHFRSVCETFSKLQRSYCGNRPENRPEDVRGLELRDLPTLEELREQFAAWLAAHHARPSEAADMFGLAPAQALEQFRGSTVRAPIDGARLDFLCSRLTDPVTVTRHGVRYRGIYFGAGCEELYKLQGTKVRLRVQPDRGDQVIVCDLEGRQLAVATHDRLTGATQEDHREAARRRASLRRVAREYPEVGPRLRRTTPVEDVIDALRKRNQSVQAEVPSPPAPESIQIVRPDIQADVSQPASSGGMLLRDAVAGEHAPLPDAFAILARSADGDSSPGALPLDEIAGLPDIGDTFSMLGASADDAADVAALPDASSMLGVGFLRVCEPDEEPDADSLPDVLAALQRQQSGGVSDEPQRKHA